MRKIVAWILSVNLTAVVLTVCGMYWYGKGVSQDLTLFAMFLGVALSSSFYVRD